MLLRLDVYTKKPKKKKKVSYHKATKSQKKKIKLKMQKCPPEVSNWGSPSLHPHSHTEKVDDHIHVTLYFSHVYVMTQLWLRTRFNDACFGDEMD